MTRTAKAVSTKRRGAPDGPDANRKDVNRKRELRSAAGSELARESKAGSDRRM